MHMQIWFIDTICCIKVNTDYKVHKMIEIHLCNVHESVIQWLQIRVSALLREPVSY